MLLASRLPHRTLLMENTPTLEITPPVKIQGTHPLLTISVAVTVITLIVGSGTYVSMMRKGERMPDTGFKQLIELFTPKAAE